MTDQYGPEDARAADAGEYVLGVLTAAERRDFEARVVSEPGLARAVDFWLDRFEPLLDEIEPVAPPARVKARIMRSLFAIKAPQPRRRGLAFWQVLAAGATGTAAAASILLALVVLRGPIVPHIQPLPREVIAVLAPTEGTKSLFIRVQDDLSALEVVDAAINARGRSPELWIIPDGENPTSLGLIRSQGTTRVMVPADLRNRVTETTALAVSLEPPGGSPTGPIIVLGPIRVI